MTSVIRWLAVACIGLGLSVSALEVGDTHTHPAAGAEAGHAEHHGLPSAAVPIFQIGPFVVTNSMVTVWIAALFIIGVAQVATRRLTFVPEKLQNFCEWLIESLYEFLEGILGKELIRKTFWFFATVFIVILFTNWLGLLPGVGTIGWGHTAANGRFVVTEPLFRGGNADLNMTLAMALLFCVLWVIWAIQANGVVGVLKHLFAPGSDATGFMKIFMTATFLVVGVLEVMSIAFRPVSLSLRLYGNVFAGENILESMMNLVPWLGWALPVPFYFLELLVGLVQALVFTLLTAVFTLLICEHAEEGGHGHGHEHAGGEHSHPGHSKAPATTAVAH